MQKVSYIFSYICCLLRQRLSKIFIFRKKFRRGPNYCSDFYAKIKHFLAYLVHFLITYCLSNELNFFVYTVGLINVNENS